MKQFTMSAFLPGEEIAIHVKSGEVFTGHLLCYDDGIEGDVPPSVSYTRDGFYFGVDLDEIAYIEHGGKIEVYD